MWLSEVTGNVTPISEGFEFECPKRKLTPEEPLAIGFAKVFSRNAIGRTNEKFLKETKPVKPKRILDKIAERAKKKKRRVFRLWVKSGKNHKQGETNARSRKI